MKKNICNPTLRVIRFDSKDVIATSFNGANDKEGYSEEGYEGGYAPGRYNPGIWD